MAVPDNQNRGSMSYPGPVVERCEGNSARMAEGVVLSGAEFGVPTAPGRGGAGPVPNFSPPPLLVLALERQAAAARPFSFYNLSDDTAKRPGYCSSSTSPLCHLLRAIVLFSSSHPATLGQLRQIDSTVVAAFLLLKPWSNRTAQFQRQPSQPPFLSEGINLSEGIPVKLLKI
ncbi:hypothetical protein LY78DRAFT_40014 [Colletotrichum sublineola]|nr:hypothetical protein LY78DRAFT_40014 [Colletotrichum sublineola]